MFTKTSFPGIGSYWTLPGLGGAYIDLTDEPVILTEVSEPCVLEDGRTVYCNVAARLNPGLIHFLACTNFLDFNYHCQATNNGEWSLEQAYGFFYTEDRPYSATSANSVVAVLEVYLQQAKIMVEFGPIQAQVIADLKHSLLTDIKERNCAFSQEAKKRILNRYRNWQDELVTDCLEREESLESKLKLAKAQTLLAMKQAVRSEISHLGLPNEIVRGVEEDLQLPDVFAS